MTIAPSIAGLSSDLRDLPIGGVLARAARVRIADREDLRTWQSKATATAAKLPGSYTTQTFNAVDETFDHAIRVIAITRLA